MTKLWLGVDPGKSGGLTALNEEGEIVYCQPLSKNEMEVIEQFEEVKTHIRLNGQVCAVMERVWGQPVQGVKTAFIFGESYGFLKACLYNIGASWEEVIPQKWMKELGFPIKKGESQPERKKRLRAFAQRRYPKFELWNETRTVGKQMAIADSMLIATYCRKVFT